MTTGHNSRTLSAENILSFQRNILPRIIFGLIGMLILLLISRQNYLLYHSLVEIFSISISFGIFLIIWNSSRFLDSDLFLILAIGITFSALFDLVHFMSYRGVGILIFHSEDPANLATQLWIAGRFVQALAYFSATAFTLRRFQRWQIAMFFLLISFLLFSMIFSLRIFPVAYDANGLTLFKKLSEYLFSFIFILSAFFIYRRRTEFDPTVYKALIVSLILTALSELSFTLYIDVYGFFNFIGHILKIVAFYFVYRAIIVTALRSPHNLLFYHLQTNEAKLELSQRSLRLKNIQLAREKGHVEALLWSMGDAVVAMDNDGLIQYTNPVFNRLIRRSASELKGAIVFDVFALLDEKGRHIPISSRPLTVAISRKSSPPSIRRSNVSYVDPAGNHKFLAVTASPIVEKGKIIGAIGIYRDTTRERDIDRTKTEYVSFAAHQLRTPLSTMKLTIEMATRDLEKKKLGNLSDYFHEIAEETIRMSQTINQFLNVTKIEAGLLPITPAPTAIPFLVDDQILLLQPKIKKKQTKVTTYFDPELPPISVDVKVLDIILDNLISNAIKYCNNNGEIKVLISKRGRSVIITVSDNGPGIPKRYQSRVFEKMFRATSAKKSEGTGLGLYIVKLLVEQSGGKIWFESDSTGTTFFVSYPMSGMKRRALKKLSS